jgi:hypothetical protein
MAGAAFGGPKVFDVFDYGAVGDGVTLDSPAIQRAIDAAAKAGRGAQVMVRSGHRYLIGTLELRGGIDFHLDGNAELFISTNRQHYSGEGVITAMGAEKLQLSGTGKINGHARDFMTGYDSKGEWYVPAEWRPQMVLLTGCKRLEIRNITLSEAPNWCLHLLGCRNVEIENITIRNLMDVPNCDGIDPDHCQQVKIRNCHITSGDDSIVIKATRQSVDYGPSADITVQDCVLETQDAALKIGTETTQDIHDIRFENCEIRACGRAFAIQLRDEGNVFNIDLRGIKFVSRYYADPWWGRGEAISLTAIPRAPGSKLGTIHHVRMRDMTGRAENSVRVSGSADSRIQHVEFDNVAVTFDRWTAYPGGLFDNRPTTAIEPIERHTNPGFSLRYADDVLLRNCSVRWGGNLPDYFTSAIETESVTRLKLNRFQGEGGHPGRDKAMAER